MNVLVLNCGSSSVKFALVEPLASVCHVSGIAQRLGTAEATLDWRQRDGKNSRAIASASHEAALRAIVDLLDGLQLGIR